MQVAPFVGAWIEIGRMSQYHMLVAVAPFVGAWIEIPVKSGSLNWSEVAPFVGAWIEMKLDGESKAGRPCRSLRGSVD